MRPGTHNAARGLIEFFTQHRTAHNLLMALMILAGLFALSNLRIQFFPDVERPTLSVTIAYPGASATEIDRALIAPLEPQLRQMADIVNVRTTAQDGFASLSLEFDVAADLNTKLEEVQRLVDAFALPDGAETPSVTKFEFLETVTRYVLTGPVRHEALVAYAQDLAQQIEDQLPATVRLSGAPPTGGRFNSNYRFCEEVPSSE